MVTTPLFSSTLDGDAPAELRKACFPSRSTRRGHNQAQQFAPGGAGHSLRSRRCARRYAAPTTTRNAHIDMRHVTEYSLADDQNIRRQAYSGAISHREIEEISP